MCEPIPSATSITPIRSRKASARILRLGWLSMNRLTAPAEPSMISIAITMASCTVLLPNLGRHRRARLIIRVILDGEEERDGQGGRGAADEFRRSVAQDREPPAGMATLRQAQVPVRPRAPAWPLLVPALARGRPAMPTIRST